MAYKFGLACVLGLAFAAPDAFSQENVLVLLADDLGVDQLAAYGIGRDVPRTPNIDALASRGVRFTRAWASPVCSPTRAMLLTGRHGFRTGIGKHLVSPDAVLPLEEITLPEMLDLGTGGGWAHAAFGKWHLGDEPAFGGLSHPNLSGFAHFSGVMGNLPETTDAYYQWEKVVNGVASDTAGYITTDTVDDVLAWAAAAPEPWFCYVAFNSAHTPYHAPPANLHTVDLSNAGAPTFSGDPRPYYKAMIEAMDTEIGRLLAGLGSGLDRTNVVFLGDNGTPFHTIVEPLDPSHCKGTPYEGGVQVPLIVAGPQVLKQGRRCDALVGATDLYATIAEIAGVDLDHVLPLDLPLDSVSMVPYLRDPSSPSARSFTYTEHFRPNGTGPLERHTAAIRNERYKIIHIWLETQPSYFRGFYDLKLDPKEKVNLLSFLPLGPDALAAYETLQLQMATLLADELSPPVFQ